MDVSAYPKAPLPSAPAKSAITKLQVSLNNLSAQVCEAVYVIAETAPPVPFDDDGVKKNGVVDVSTLEDDVKYRLAAQSRTNFEIVRRSQQIAVIIRAVRSLVNQLPDSSRSSINDELAELQRLNAVKTEELRRLTEAVANVQSVAAQVTTNLIERLREEENSASIW